MIRSLVCMPGMAALPSGEAHSNFGDHHATSNRRWRAAKPRSAVRPRAVKRTSRPAASCCPTPETRDLPGPGASADAGGGGHGGAEEVAALGDRLARVEPDADAEATLRGTRIVGRDSPLDRDRALERERDRREGRHDAVPRVLRLRAV